MRKTTALALLFALLFTLGALLCSCGDDKDEDLLGLAVAYVGPEITSAEHEFTPDEFYVVAAYPNNVDKTLESRDFKVELEDLDKGFFIVKITYRGHEQYAHVRCNVPVYPSELGENP